MRNASISTVVAYCKKMSSLFVRMRSPYPVRKLEHIADDSFIRQTLAATLQFVAKASVARAKRFLWIDTTNINMNYSSQQKMHLT